MSVIACAILILSPIASAEELKSLGFAAMEYKGVPGFWVPSALFRKMAQSHDRAPKLDQRIGELKLEIADLRLAAAADARTIGLANGRLAIMSTALDHAHSQTSAPWEGPAWFGGGFLAGSAAVVLVAWALAETLSISLTIDR